MSFARKFEKAFRFMLPSPFAIAILLSLFSFLLYWIYAEGELSQRLEKSLIDWQKGLWNGPLLVFMLQMMLILVLGHSLALAPAIKRFVEKALQFSDDPASSTALVAFFTLVLAYFNWGLALVFGAVMARKAAEEFSRKGIAFNYGILGAAGYAGLMVWHGGLSGSAPIKVAEKGHLASLSPNTSNLPERLDFTQTILSSLNLWPNLILLFLLPFCLYLLAKKAPRKLLKIEATAAKPIEESHTGAEKIDHSTLFGLAIGLSIIAIGIIEASKASDSSFINPNFINLMLLGLALSFHRSIHSFLKSIDEAIQGAAGILLQFPLYFGIMGLMKDGGLIQGLSEYFSTNSTAFSFPLYTFLSAGIINVFVPSGGGQWAIQGPVIIETASQLNIPLSKAIMAMAYGDQLTNMLQPFWALPLLGITGLKAREIVPYTLILLFIGLLIFGGALIIF